MMNLLRDRNSVIEQLQRVIHRFPALDLARFDEMVEQGEIQVFPLKNGSVMVGRVFKDGTVRIVAAAGNLDELLEFEPVCADWYKEKGCKQITLGGRGKGWHKFLQ